MPNRTNTDNQSFTIYMGKNRDLFDSLHVDIKKLWFMKYGESLSKGDAVVKALIVLKEHLTTDQPLTKKKQTLSDIYVRVEKDKNDL